MQQKNPVLLIALADPKVFDWIEREDFWQTVTEARKFFAQPIYAIIITLPTLHENPRFHFVCAITPRDDVLETVKTFIREAEIAVLFKGTTGIDVEISETVPRREEILEWIDANGGVTIQ